MIGIVRILITKLTTPPITKRTAAKSTKPCFRGEGPFILITSTIPLFRDELSVFTPGRN